jgi:D-alanyl-lipoteichoic acid acyltransferase DltB (MBOAT superfamily)
MKVRNTFAIFIVSGFWHGANWTFIVWGALNALYFLPSLLLNKNRANTDTVAQDKYLPSFKEFYQMSITFSLTVLAWVFFRAENIGHAFNYLSTIFSNSLFTIPHFTGMRHGLKTLILICGFIIIEWFGRREQYAIAKLGITWKRPIRYAMYYSIILAIFWFMGEQQQFIYFQF